MICSAASTSNSSATKLAATRRRSISSKAASVTTRAPRLSAKRKCEKRSRTLLTTPTLALTRRGGTNKASEVIAHATIQRSLLYHVESSSRPAFDLRYRRRGDAGTWRHQFRDQPS